MQQNLKRWCAMKEAEKEKNKSITSMGYREKSEALAVRIDAHKNYSNFSLEDWLKETLSFEESDIVLDIGCGSGNLFPVYTQFLGKKGIIVGMDKSKELLSLAMTCYTPTPKIVLRGDMDAYFPFGDNYFDYVISTFAIYYAENIDLTINEINRVLKPSGHFLLLGPTNKNAKELYDFNKVVFGFEKDNKVTKRTNRIEMEFYPRTKTIFQNVTINKIQRKLVFPEKEKFVEYYMATLLFEESAAEAECLPDKKTLIGMEFPSLEISKEMISLTGTKCQRK